MSPGWLRVLGLGPGPERWLTAEASDVLAQAQHLVGYHTYVARVAPREDLTVHGSDNGDERERARHALELCAGGARVVVVSGGDAGVFGMAAAVFEAVEQGPPRWRALDVAVLPAVTAMLAAAARLGAPLGNDFCAINLSDNLKPWSLIERRLSAAARADFVIALYNPASRVRRAQLERALSLLRAERAGETPVVFARAIGRADESISIVTLGEAAADRADMQTLIIVGASGTRRIERPGAPPWLYTPRRVDG